MTSAPSDADLLARCRSGDGDAYEVLYRRHAGAARALAWQLTGSAAEADDLVADAFAKVLAILRSGGGPEGAFRAYLCATVRNTRYTQARRDGRVRPVDDMTEHDPGVPWRDPAVARLEETLAARAFTRLPERWRTVLWHTAVERSSPADVAPLLGLSANGVAALAYRAREGLRQAYLQEHVAHRPAGAHGATTDRLGAWTRGRLPAGQHASIQAHLDSCGGCRHVADELVAVNGELR